MTTRRVLRLALLAGVGFASAGCATANPDVFARQEQDAIQEAKEAAAADRVVCPVVVSNATDHQLEAAYASTARWRL